MPFLEEMACLQYLWILANAFVLKLALSQFLF